MQLFADRRFKAFIFCLFSFVFLLGNPLPGFSESERAKKLILLASDLMDENADSSLMLLDQAMSYAIKDKDSLSIGSILVKKGLFYNLKNQFQTERSFYYEAIALYNRINNPAKAQGVFGYLAYSYRLTGTFDSAIYTYGRMAHEALLKKDTVMYMNVLNDQGITFQMLSDFGKAADNYYQVIRLSRKLKDHAVEARSWYNLGTINQTLNNFNEALEQFKNSEKIYAGEIKDSVQLATLYLAKARVYADIGHNDSAEYFFNKGIVLAESIHSDNLKVAALMGVAFYRSLNKEYSSALREYTRAYDLACHLFDRVVQVDILLELGKTYQKLNAFRDANINFRQAWVQATELKNPTQQRDAALGLSETYSSLQDYQQALKFLMTYHMLKDSTTKSDTRVKYEQVKSLYNIELKDHEIERLKHENLITQLNLAQKRRIQYFAIGALLFLLIFVFFILKINQKVRHVNQLLDKKNQEFELQNTRLERSNKDLEQFAYVASHDLNQPLRNISSFTDILEKKYGHLLDSEGKEFLNFIKNSSIRMSRLLHDLLEYGKVDRQANVLGEVNLNVTLNEVRENLKLVIEETNTRLVIPKTLPVVRAHHILMVQLFQNLINNSIKYRKANVNAEIRIEWKPKGNFYEFTVSDNGIGFDQKYKDRVFALFRRLHTPGEYEGSGIGLAICKRIVEIHDGTITAESELGVGTKMIFTLLR